MPKLISIIFVLLFATIIKFLIDIDVFNSYSNINDFADCHYLSTDMPGPEDIQYYKDNILITASGNFGKVFAKGTPELEQLGIYAIIESHRRPQVKKMPLIDFPKNISLYSHGIYIKDDQLFVINNAFKYGGDRVEVFNITQNLSLIHIHSIIMDERYNGILNDLIVVPGHRFLITKYLAYTDPLEGRKEIGLLETTLHLLIPSFLLKLKWTYVIDCTYETNQKFVIPKCKELDNTKSIMANGITWDRNNKVWVADTLAKRLDEYQLVSTGLQFIRHIEIGSAIDNVEFDNRTNSLYLGLIPKLVDYFKIDAFWKDNKTLDRETDFNYLSAISQYDLKTNEHKILVQNRYLSKATTAGFMNGNNVYIGSWCDISLMVCRKI